MSDTFTLDTVAELLGPVVSRHASVRDDEGGWVPDGAPLFDETDAIVFVSAELHASDARDAAIFLLDALDARGFKVCRDIHYKADQTRSVSA